MAAVPQDYLCSITLDIMTDPVVCSDGHTYERSAIEQWFQQGNTTSPKTNAELPSRDLIPNIALRAAIEEWKQRHQQAPRAAPPTCKLPGCGKPANAGFEFCGRAHGRLHNAQLAKASAPAAPGAGAAQCKLAGCTRAANAGFEFCGRAHGRQHQAQLKAAAPKPSASAAAAPPPAPVVAAVPVTVSAVGYREADDSATVQVTVTPAADGARQPCTLVCVVDISGSMGNLAALPEANAVESNDFTRLDLVVHSIKTMVSVLGPQDQLALVTFSNDAAVVQQLVAMTDANKARVTQLLDRLAPDDCTNLWAGLRQGLEIARSPAAANSNVATVLFTDGLPNRNPPRGILAELRAYLGKNRPACTIHTFGYGYELDSGLLNEIARDGNGVYGYIPDSTMVGTTFVNMVSNAVAVCARNVRLHLTADPKAGVAAVEVVGFNTIDQETSVGVLQYGQARSLVVRLALDKAAVDAFLQRPNARVLAGSLQWQTLDAAVNRADVSSKHMMDALTHSLRNSPSVPHTRNTHAAPELLKAHIFDPTHPRTRGDRLLLSRMYVRRMECPLSARPRTCWRAPCNGSRRRRLGEAGVSRDT
eukprot:TRINITY_DN5833_c0_g2_i1.p1 TRINITY_DN5833_c0_g2~~TRINITY_DN5833_c0_g2_i1.p1  ORF type:complete len:590 (+),score=147.89 TRINITY_DN5833_c0_g2_i1:196-1965(+)